MGFVQAILLTIITSCIQEIENTLRMITYIYCLLLLSTLQRVSSRFHSTTAAVTVQKNITHPSCASTTETFPVTYNISRPHDLKSKTDYSAEVQCNWNTRDQQPKTLVSLRFPTGTRMCSLLHHIQWVPEALSR